MFGELALCAVVICHPSEEEISPARIHCAHPHHSFMGTYAILQKLGKGTLEHATYSGCMDSISESFQDVSTQITVIVILV